MAASCSLSFCGALRLGGSVELCLRAKHGPCLLGLERLELELPGEATHRRRVDRVHQVGGGDEDAVEALHALQQLVDLRHRPLRAGQRAVTQERIGLVEEQQRSFGIGLGEHRGDLLLGLPDPLGQQIRSRAQQDRQVELDGDVLGQLRLACPGDPPEAERALRALAQRRNDLLGRESPRDVEVVEAVAGDRVAQPLDVVTPKHFLTLSDGALDDTLAFDEWILGGLSLCRGEQTSQLCRLTDLLLAQQVVLGQVQTQLL